MRQNMPPATLMCRFLTPDGSRRRSWGGTMRQKSLMLSSILISGVRLTQRILPLRRKLPIVPDARLREYDYGAMTQYPVAEVEQEFPRRIREPFPNGESLLMVVQRVGAFLRDVLRSYDEKTIVVIGHRATRYGLAYWCDSASLEDIVLKPWEWRDVPIWRYELHAHNLERPLIVS